MSVRWKIALVIWVIAALLAVGAIVGTAAAQKGNPTPPPSEKMSAASASREAAAKQWLLLMDKNKDGRVSKQEWMSFMEQEFDRLDTDKDGYLDPKDLEKSRLRLVPLSKVGK